MEKRYRDTQSGHALVILLVFVTVALSVSLAAATLSAYSITNASNMQISLLARNVAESGMENALLRLLRDPSYVGETLTSTEGTAVVTVTGTTTKTITSVGTVGNFKHTVAVTASYTNGILSIVSWNDVF